MTTATGFNAIVGQPNPVRLIRTYLRHGTVPHALLFTGDDGVGKKMTATAFAMACNCLTLKSALSPHLPLDAVDACGDCTPCRKIAGDHHPDIIRIAPLSSVIKIAQIRMLLQTLTRRPNEADRRVVILSEAQSMNAEAGNALLKVLEEPPNRTLLVLTGRHPSEVLPTVVSRCRHIRFSPLPAADVRRLLEAGGGSDSKSVETVAALCGGSYTRAQRLSDRRWLDRREWIVRTMESHMAGGRIPEIRAWLAFSEMLSKKKDLIEESLEIVTIWLRDLLIVRFDPGRVINQDRLEALSAAAEWIGPDQLIRQIDAVERALAALRSNMNPRLTLDAMVVRMAGARCPGSH